MEKRGQGVFGLSYGVIFSIIVIIAVIALAFYAINYFLGLNKCTEVGFYFQDLEKEIDRAWAASTHRSSFEIEVPSGITHACFGPLSGNVVNAEDSAIKTVLQENFPGPNHNIFIYPIEKACDGDLFSFQIEHATAERFFCIDLRDSNTIRLEKNSDESLVTISEI